MKNSTTTMKNSSPPQETKLVSTAQPAGRDSVAIRSWSDADIQQEIEKLRITKKLFFNNAQYCKYIDWGLGSVSRILTAAAAVIYSDRYISFNPPILSPNLLRFCAPAVILSWAAIFYIEPHEEHLIQHRSGVEYNILYRKLSDASKLPPGIQRDLAIKALREEQDEVERKHAKFTPDFTYDWARKDYMRRKKEDSALEK